MLNPFYTISISQILKQNRPKYLIRTKIRILAMTKSSFFLVLLLSFLLAASHISAAKAMPGGWYPIKNLTDPHVKDLGAFAVSEHDKAEKDSLVFVQVVKGEQQVVAGMNYKLVLEAKNAKGEVAQYVAVVWEKLWANFRQLTSFKLASS